MSKVGVARIAKNVVTVGFSSYITARSAGLNNTLALGAAAGAIVVNLIGLFQTAPHQLP